MPSAVERFSNRVENYVKYRPGYPPEVLRFFKNKLNLRDDSVVADIGAGTGISTRIFLENGNSVYAVEPNRAMREAAERFLKDFPNFTAVDGTSEKTTLPDDSIDFIVAAQAFHWFDAAKTLPEFRRIVKSGGCVALMWNERQLDSNDFLREYESFLHEYATDYNEVRHENVTLKEIGEFFPHGFQKATFGNSQTLDYEALKGRLLSSSYTPTAEHERFPAMIEKLGELFETHQKNDTIQILYDTNVYYGQI